MQRVPDHRLDQAVDDADHLTLQRGHVLEVAKHGAQADVGTGSDLLGGGAHHAFAQELEHRVGDLLAGRDAAVAAQVGAGDGRFRSALHRTTL